MDEDKTVDSKQTVVCSSCETEQPLRANKSFVCVKCRAWNQYPPAPADESEEPSDIKRKDGKWLS